jgi:hypothetical protein
MIDFNARTSPELVWSKNIVAVEIKGKEKKKAQQQEPQMQMMQQAQDELKEDRAKRVSTYQNYQLSEQMENWREEQDKNLLVLPCVGTSYKVTYYDYDDEKVKSDLYLANQIIFNHGFNNFSDAPDKFINLSYTKNEVIGFIRGENKWDLSEDDLEEDVDKYDFVKAYTWFDLDDDGLKEPYCAIVCDKTSKIVALYPYFDEDTIQRNAKDEVVKVKSLDMITQYKFLPDPEGGPMGLGWGILFGPLFDSINTNMRQMIDAATFQNVAGSSGFITQSLAGGLGNSTESGPIELSLGKLTPINSRGVSIKDSIWQPPAAGPSPVLFQLMEYLVQAARSMANASVNVEAVQGEAAALYLARLQQGLKVPNSITMRVYSAAKKEKQKIALLNFKHFDDEFYNRVIDEDIQYSMKADFDPKDCDIVMAVDPANGSDIERIQRAETVLQEAKSQTQQVLNLRQAYLDYLNAIGHPDVDSIAPEPDPNAQDPMQQMMVAQMQMDAEFKKKDQELRENTLLLQEQKLNNQQREFDTKEVTELKKFTHEMALKLTDLELKYKQDLGKPGIGADLNYDLVFDPATGALSNARN